MFGSMSLCCILLCSGASVGIPKAAMVHQPDRSSHRTDRERRALVSPLEPRSDGFIGTFPGRAAPATCLAPWACATYSCALRRPWASPRPRWCVSTTSAVSGRERPLAEAPCAFAALWRHNVRLHRYLPRSRSTDGLLTSMGLGYIFLCFGTSVGIAKAAMVHEDDLPSHRTARLRLLRERLVTTS